MATRSYDIPKFHVDRSRRSHVLELDSLLQDAYDHDFITRHIELRADLFTAVLRASFMFSSDFQIRPGETVSLPFQVRYIPIVSMAGAPTELPVEMNNGVVVRLTGQYVNPEYFPETVEVSPNAFPLGGRRMLEIEKG